MQKKQDQNLELDTVRVFGIILITTEKWPGPPTREQPNSNT
jgi:hypothetical protein